MFTKKSDFSAVIILAVLILLTLVMICPFLTKDFVNASEIEKSVDVISYDDNQEEMSSEDLSGPDKEKKHKKGHKDKKNKKKHKKNSSNNDAQSVIDEEQVFEQGNDQKAGGPQDSTDESSADKDSINNEDNESDKEATDMTAQSDESSDEGIDEDVESDNDDVDSDVEPDFDSDIESDSESDNNNDSEKDSDKKSDKKSDKHKNKSEKDNHKNTNEDPDVDQDVDSNEDNDIALDNNVDTNEDTDLNVQSVDEDSLNEDSISQDPASEDSASEDPASDNSRKANKHQDMDLSDDTLLLEDEGIKNKAQSKNGKSNNNNNNNEENSSDDSTGGYDYIAESGFPTSYEGYLSELQAAHPNWNFVPAYTGVTWKQALDAEDEGSRNLIDPSAPSSQKEGGGSSYDGHWAKANRKAIGYYMDPRNFLNENGIYQFLQQTYDGNSQNEDTVSDIIDGSFMEGKDPKGKGDNFAECINEAGAKANVNPNVLAAMIIMEQGWKGSSLSSGTKDGYKGYYNFFNIGAWTTSSMSSVERGLWYAKGEGEGNTSYERPWDSPYKAILGGAEFYYANYISANQDTYYTKKFNVMNGAGELGEHQYMTNVEGAYGEGRLVSMAYENHGDLPATFLIPVYEEMPMNVRQLP